MIERKQRIQAIFMYLFNKMGAEVSMRDIDIAHREANCLQVRSQTGKD